MSEFSESYHLRSERVEDAVELLRRAERKGYVFPAGNGWVTFVADEGVFEPGEHIVAAAKHPLLHYVCAEDHGWSFALFDHNESVSRYRCDWDDEIRFDDSQYSREALQRIVPSVQFADFEEQFRVDDLDELFEAEPAKLFAHALGLEHYEWLAYDYVANDFGEPTADLPGVIKVG
jgi:hypothetical protein